MSFFACSATSSSEARIDGEKKRRRVQRKTITEECAILDATKQSEHTMLFESLIVFDFGLWKIF